MAKPLQRMSADEYQAYLKRQTPEKEVQSQIITALEVLGYVEPWRIWHLEKSACRRLSTDELIAKGVNGIRLVSGTTRRQGDYHGTMQTAGIPDLRIRPIEAPFYVDIEVKRAVGGVVTPEQEVAMRGAVAFVVRSATDIPKIIDAIETAFRLLPAANSFTIL